MFTDNNNNMDAKIRNAIEQFSDAGIIPDWEQLERKLDIEMPVKKKRRRLVLLWIVFAILSGSLSYIWYNAGPKNKPHNPSVAEITKQNLQPVEAARVQPEENESSETLLPSHYKGKELQSVTSTSSFEAKSTYETIREKTLPASVTKKVPKKNITYNGIKLSGDNAVFNKGNTEKITATDYLPKEESKKQIISSHYPSAKNDLVSNSSNPSSSLNDSTINALSPFPKDSIVEKGNANAKAKKHSKLNSKITFTLSGGTNFNSVQLNQPSRAGYDYGLLLGYRFSKNFEIRSGVILSKKYFKTTGNNLSFDSAKLNLPSYNSIKLEDATGYCRFIEIPVMLYYRFPASKKTNFYAAGGFSVNKMRMENIDYTFLADGSTVIERSHANAYHKNSGFSTSLTSNFAVGINRSINKAWNLSVEPYAKFPLTRFNDNNLKFSTFGVSLSATYSLSAKRRK